MMVDKDYSGQTHQTAALLPDKNFEWAREQNFKRIYPGTMQQFKAAQKFYCNKGFKEISKEVLPTDYISNPIDTLFYMDQSLATNNNGHFDCYDKTKSF